MTYTIPPDKATGGTITVNDWNVTVRDNFADHEARLGSLEGSVGAAGTPFAMITYGGIGTHAHGTYVTPTGTLTVDQSNGLMGVSGPATGTAGTSYFWEVNGWFRVGDTLDSGAGEETSIEWSVGFDDLSFQWQHQNPWGLGDGYPITTQSEDGSTDLPDFYHTEFEERHVVSVKGCGIVTGTNDANLAIKGDSAGTGTLLFQGGTVFWTCWTQWDT